MAFLFTVPVGNALPWYKFVLPLSGTLYTLHFRYNGRMQRWLMDVNDSSDNQILSGIVLLIERNITGQYDTLALPPGIFFATDDSGQESEPTLYSFGLDHTLWYADTTQGTPS
jgi:hypothetical protein